MSKTPLRFLLCLTLALFIASAPVFAFDIVDSEDMVQIVEPPSSGETDVTVVDSGSDTSKPNPSTGEAANRLIFLVLVSAGVACLAGKKLGDKIREIKQF
jgi:hypothetical protein